MKVLIINGYSARNHGDGLLVDLAVELIHDALGEDVEVAAVVRDAPSFAGRPYRIISEFSGDGGAAVTLGGAAALLTAGRIGFSGQFTQAMRDADLIVSVGGAYLRGGHATELAKSTLVHVSQLRFAGRAGKPWVMLPQSIGPYGRGIRRIISRLISLADAVFLRDDKSAREFAELSQAHRVPDSAILALARQQTDPEPRPSASGRRVGLVLRALDQAPDYEPALRSLIDALGDLTVVPLVQSDVGGNDDGRFYERLGMITAGSLQHALAAEEVDVVLSVRLHGALEAVLSGVPAVHLSYERKGISAFADLGLSNRVFDARAFDPSAVSAAVRETIDEPEAYWASTREHLDAIAGARATVLVALRDIHTGEAAHGPGAARSVTSV